MECSKQADVSEVVGLSGLVVFLNGRRKKRIDRHVVNLGEERGWGL